MLCKVRHFGVYVKNMNKCVRFYESLGFKIIYQEEEKWDKLGRLYIVKLKFGDHIIELIKQKRLFPKVTKHAHFCFEVESCTEFFNDFKGKVYLNPRLSGLFIVGFIKDPNGNLVEIVKDCTYYG